MTEYDERVEARARAIFVHGHGRPESDWDLLPDVAVGECKDDFREYARATFIADIEDGYCTVPKEATEGMIDQFRAFTLGPLRGSDKGGVNAAIAAGAVKEDE